MQAQKTVNRLATAGALIALAGVVLAAKDALAADPDMNEAAVVKLDNSLDLDIRPIDHSLEVLVGGL